MSTWTTVELRASIDLAATSWRDRVLALAEERDSLRTVDCVRWME